MATTDLQEAFTNINYAILVGAMPRKEGMERKDLLKANCGIFKVQGKALNDYANKDVKVRFVSFLFKKALEQDDSRTLKRVSSPRSRPIDDVQVLVVGNPANTNALIAALSAPGLPKENFSCLTRLDHNRAKSQISKRLNINVNQVHNVIIWGNHSKTQYPDVNHAYISGSASTASLTLTHIPRR